MSGTTSDLYTAHMQIDALIFDADGTLVDSEVPGLDVIHELANEHGLPLDREVVHSRFRGMRMADVVAHIAAGLGEGHSFHEPFTRLVRRRQAERFKRGLMPMSGAVQLLQNLTVPFCVATNGPLEKVTLTLSLCGLDVFLKDRVFSAYEVGSFKPEPGLFLHAANALRVHPSRCAVVEDSHIGVEAGLAAGMHVFALMPRSETMAEWTDRVVCIEGLDAVGAYLQRMKLASV